MRMGKEHGFWSWHWLGSAFGWFACDIVRDGRARNPVGVQRNLRGFVSGLIDTTTAESKSFYE